MRNVVAHCWQCGQDEYLLASGRFTPTKCPRCGWARESESLRAADLSDRRQSRIVIRAWRMS